MQHNTALIIGSNEKQKVISSPRAVIWICIIPVRNIIIQKNEIALHFQAIFSLDLSKMQIQIKHIMKLVRVEVP